MKSMASKSSKKSMKSVSEGGEDAEATKSATDSTTSKSQAGGKSLKKKQAKEAEEDKFKLVQRSSSFYYYLFDHLDIFGEKRIFPDELLSLEKLMKGNVTLSELYAERTRSLKERQMKLRLQESGRRNMMEEQMEHCKLLEDLKATRNTGKQQTENFFKKLEKVCGSVLRGWIALFDDGAGRCGFERFREICNRQLRMREVGIEMWSFLDFKKRGFLTIENFDPEIRPQLAEFKDCCVRRYAFVPALPVVSKTEKIFTSSRGLVQSFTSSRPIVP